MKLDPCSLPLLLLLCIITASNGFPVNKPEHVDPTLPPVLPGQTPKCSAVVLQQDFGGVVGLALASANYTHPGECPYPWTRVVLEVSVSATDVRKHRVASVWLDGAEVLRTATPIPTAPGTYWTVQKDVTRHAALVRRLAAIYMKLEDSSDTFSGVYSATVSLHFYRNSIEQTNNLAVTAHPTVMGLYREPADLILPIFDENGYFGSGFWLRVNDEYRIASSAVKIPMNAYRAVLEVFVSYHGDDDNWYTNPLRAAYLDHPTNLSAPPRMNGGFRQVYATIDGRFVGAHIPFPVIYPGTINRNFWSPVASIGAFDMPSYDIDITPFLGLLLDGRKHEFGLGVHDAQPYWLLSGNLHLWIDHYSDSCRGGVVEYDLPPLRVIRVAEWLSVDGQSEITAEGVHRFVGWVSSSRGNITTFIQQDIKFATEVEVTNLGSTKQVEVSNNERIQIEVLQEQEKVRRAEFMMDAPLQVRTSSVSDPAGGMASQEMKLFHSLEEVLNVFDSQKTVTSRLADRQDAEGSAMARDGEPLWETGTTKSQYKYSDESTCVFREVNAEGGVVVMDKNSSCSSVSGV